MYLLTTQADHQECDCRVPFFMLFNNFCAWKYFIHSVFDSHSYSLCQSQLAVHSYDLASKYQQKQKRHVFLLYFVFLSVKLDLELDLKHL